tara:strand:+ start:2157 stop:2396 length:240 start_codon:yes stop_codon:yes gene_type:complete
MSTIKRYNKVFMEIFEIKESELENLNYQDIPQWDSLGHMSMVGALEDEFDIMLEMDDIIDFSSYKKGMETLAKYGVSFE